MKGGLIIKYAAADAAVVEEPALVFFCYGNN